MKKRFIICSFLLFMMIFIISLFHSVFLQFSEQNPTLDTVLGSENCNKACWNGFEPLVASRASVEDWLNESGKSYDIIGDNYNVLMWNINMDRLIINLTIDVLPIIHMEFTEENILWRTAIFDSHICTNTIINTYGVPKLVNTDQQNIRLGYPDEGLLFSMHVDDALFPYAITSMFITSSEWVEHFVRPNQSWKDISYIAEEGHCQDAFSVQ